MHDLTYVIYSHTDYLDVLKVHSDYLSSYSNKILLINKNDFELDELYTKYKKVLFYDDSLPYASRLLILNQLNLIYILFIHDIDIIVKKNELILNNLVYEMIKHNIDRIDLQYRHKKWIYDKNPLNLEIDSQKFILYHRTDITNYTYNVNPSIWKLSSFISIMSRFRNETYRSIENSTIQDACAKEFKTYGIYAEQFINSGWFGCVEWFQYIHILKKGMSLPPTNNNLDGCLLNDYNNIINRLYREPYPSYVGPLR